MRPMAADVDHRQQALAGFDLQRLLARETEVERIAAGRDSQGIRG